MSYNPRIRGVSTTSQYQRSLLASTCYWLGTIDFDRAWLFKTDTAWVILNQLLFSQELMVQGASLASLLCLFCIMTLPPGFIFTSFCYLSASPSDNIYVKPNPSQSFFVATALDVSRVREGNQEEYFCHCLWWSDTLAIQHFLRKPRVTPWEIAMPTNFDAGDVCLCKGAMESLWVSTCLRVWLVFWMLSHPFNVGSISKDTGELFRVWSQGKKA